MKRKLIAYCVIDGVKLYIVSPGCVSSDPKFAYYLPSYDVAIEMCNKMFESGFKYTFYVYEKR